MTTQADIKLVIDQLDQICEPLLASDYDNINSAVDMLEKLGNQVAKQAAVIEKLRDALNGIDAWVSANFDWGCIPMDIVRARAALAIPTDSTQILQEWLDSVLGEPVYWTDNAGSFCFGHSANTPMPLFKKPVLK